MHTMWKGSISFGLVNVPIKMFAATEEKDIKMRYLHSECKTPVKNVRTCPNCEKDIEWGDVVRGYEYQPDQFVLISDEDMEKIAPQRSKTIDILHFVNLEEIDPIYFTKSYYLAPAEETGSKAYALLRQAMQETGKIAIAKVIIRSKQILAVLRTYEDVLVMEAIYYPDEVRSVGQVPAVPRQVELHENEVKMATQLIESLTAPFEPEQYRDEYRMAMLEAIEKKVEGEEITQVAEPRRNEINDLMKALQASLNAASDRDESLPVAVGENRVVDVIAHEAGDGAEGEAKPKRRRRRVAE